MFWGSSWAQTISSRLRQAADQLGDGLDRKRVELLETGDRNVRCIRPLVVADDVEVHLAAADDEPTSVTAG